MQKEPRKRASNLYFRRIKEKTADKPDFLQICLQSGPLDKAL